MLMIFNNNNNNDMMIGEERLIKKYVPQHAIFLRNHVLTLKKLKNTNIYTTRIHKIHEKKLTKILI